MQLMEDPADLVLSTDDAMAGRPPHVDRATPWTPMTGLGVVAVVIWGLVVSPAAIVPSWSWRTAFLPVVVAFGIPVLVSAWRGPLRPAALSGSAFAVLAITAAVFSDNPDLSATGRYGVAAGAVFAVALVSAWALGTATVTGRDTVIRTIGVVVGINAVLGVAQVLLDPAIPAFRLVNGRAAGLLGNPVHLASLLTAGLGLLLFSARRWSTPWLAAAAGLAFAIQSTGTRLTLIVIPVLLVAVMVRGGVRKTAVAALVVVAATAVGAVTLDDDATASSVERLPTTVGEANERIETWKAAGSAVAEKPILGWGPGLFLDATAPRQSQTLAAATPDSTLFSDAHNLAIEYTVTTGLLGVAALAAFGLFALARARGPLLVFGLVLLAFHTIQPQSPATTPLLFFALGSAATTPPSEGLAHKTRWAIGGMLLPALAASALFAIGDRAYQESTVDWLMTDAMTAHRLLPQWPQPTAQAARIKLFESVARNSPEAEAEGIEWLERTIAADPADPGAWNELGFVEASLGDLDAAETRFLRALEADPWSVQALVSLADIAIIRGDVDAARVWAARVALVSSSQRVRELQTRVDALP